MKVHLTSKQVTEWRSGVSDAEEILLLDDHLAECSACRALVADDLAADSATAMQMLRAEFSSEHLRESQLDDYAARRPLPADVMLHLDSCTACRGDAEDLRQFADANQAESKVAATREGQSPVAFRKPIPNWARSMAAAVAIAALGLSVWFANGRQHPERSGVQAPVEMAYEVPAPYRDEVKAAIDSGSLLIPAAVAAMAAGPVQLRSTEVREPVIHVLSPLATAVVEDTPLFRWTPVEGATFTVSVYDDQFHQVASGAGLKGAEWRADQPLQRGAVYRWEVRAVKGKVSVSAPAPTEPEARFAVLGAAEAQRLLDARAAMPGASLALGILFGDAGALDDARRELIGAAAGQDPKQKAAAERLLAQLK